MKRRVLVTGGAKGIGKAIVEELAKSKYEVVATCNESQKTANALEKKYSNLKFYRVNLMDRNSLDKFTRDLKKQHKSIDILVNNAGIYLGKPFKKNSEQEILTQIDLMLTAPTLLIRKLFPSLKKGKDPLIVNISSHAAGLEIPGESLYSAVKAAISKFSQILQAEFNPEGVRIVYVEPGGVNTYGITEPSGILRPKELAAVIRYIIELPAHIQVDKLGLSHIKQWRGDYPEWIEK